MDLQGDEKQVVRTEQIGRPALHDVHPDQDTLSTTQTRLTARAMVRTVTTWSLNREAGS